MKYYYFKWSNLDDNTLQGIAVKKGEEFPLTELHMDLKRKFNSMCYIEYFYEISEKEYKDFSSFCISNGHGDLGDIIEKSNVLSLVNNERV